MPATPRKKDDLPDRALENAIWNDPALLDALQKTQNGVQGQKLDNPSPIWSRVWVGALAASIFVTLLSWPLLQTTSEPSPSFSVPSPQHFAVAEPAEVTLSDGSQVALNRQANLLFSEASDRRVAKLTKGEAYFSVKKDAARPFIVATGQANIEVLGTAFNVDQTLQQTTIDVYHGKVAVFSADKRTRVELVKGQRARVHNNLITVSTVSGSQPDWQTGWLDLEDVSINDAVYQLNRYAEKPIVLREVDAGIRVSGWFKTSDIPGATSLIAQLHELTVTSTSDSTILSPGE